MGNYKKAHCLFEQSGTFKNAFIELGIVAEDYDIQNEFGQTDHVIDLFSEIEKAYEGGVSIFDDIKSDELIMAFFPCTRFEQQILLSFWGQQKQDKGMSDEAKLERCIKLHEELHQNYVLVSKLMIVCLRKNIPIIFENPQGEQHYLTRYWCLKPKVVDKNRRLNGDCYKKPTQFWFVNCDPKDNIIFEPIEYVEETNWCWKNATERSMIHPQYARRFIKRYILDNYDTFEYLNKVMGIDNAGGDWSNYMNPPIED